jgi:hypothetical protein
MRDLAWDSASLYFLHANPSYCSTCTFMCGTLFRRIRILKLNYELALSRKFKKAYDFNYILNLSRHTNDVSFKIMRSHGVKKKFFTWMIKGAQEG